ncbi:MAG: hypothetical protein R3Y26_01820 [Rikenellaceae bacterium]
MKNINNVYIVFIAIIMMTSCDKLNFLKQQERVLLASVGEKEFYFDDLDTVLFKGLSSGDSLLILEAYIDKWVRNELKLNESALILSNKQLEDIERKIEDYRISLITFNYNRALAAIVDTLVSNQEITDYYNENKHQFKLISPIVQAKVIMFDEGSKQEQNFKELVDSYKSDAKIDLIDLSKKEILKFNDYSEQWYYFNDIVNVLPFTDKNLDNFLKHNTSYEVTESGTTYYLKIMDYNLTGDYMPLNMVSSTIKTAILNERRKHYIQEVEDSLYNSSLRSGIVKIEKQDSVKWNSTKIDSLRQTKIQN